MTLRKVIKVSFSPCFSLNVVILLLLAVTFLIIVQRNLLDLGDILSKENPDAGMSLPFESELSPELRLESVRKGEEIPVLITAAEDRLGAVVAAMNSVYQNSQANVVFTIVTLNHTVDHLSVWLSNTWLKNVKYKIVLFKPELLNGKISKDPQTLEDTQPLTFARFYLPVYIPEAEKAIYLDDDVQGDIQELYETPIKPGHAAAFSDDCDSASAKGLIRGAGNQKDAIKKLGMRANTCSFSPGVIVATMTEWWSQNVTRQLEHWMELNTQEDLYSKTLEESAGAPPLLIVFYKRHSFIDPMWHVRHLGTTGAGNRYSHQFVKAAKLRHWNDHYKPWGRTSSFSNVWEKWFIPDPTGTFIPVRKHSVDDKTEKSVSGTLDIYNISRYKENLSLLSSVLSHVPLNKHFSIPSAFYGRLFISRNSLPLRAEYTMHRSQSTAMRYLVTCKHNHVLKSESK